MTQESAASQRRQLGAVLRSFRNEAGIVRDAAAELIEATGPTLTRKEQGLSKFKRQEVETLGRAYGIGEDELTVLMDLAKEARARTKRGEFPNFVPVQGRAFLELERNDAVEIMAVTLSFIPPHFQTEAYMRELWRRSGELPTPDLMDELVALRLARQHAVTKDDPPTIRAVIHEFALRLPVSGPAVMRDQLTVLAEACDLPHVEIQVQPIAAGAYPGMDSTFSILRFADAADMVEVEGYPEYFYRDRKSATEPYRIAWDRRRIAALDLLSSKELILSAAAEYEAAATG
jgi:hypothetical protein